MCILYELAPVIIGVVFSSNFVTSSWLDSGSSSWNKEGIFGSSCDGPLDGTGRVSHRRFRMSLVIDNIIVLIPLPILLVEDCIDDLQSTSFGLLGVGVAPDTFQASKAQIWLLAVDSHRSNRIDNVLLDSIPVLFGKGRFGCSRPR